MISPFKPANYPLHDGDEAARLANLAKILVSWKSETGTPGEAAFSQPFRDLLNTIPYFRDNPDHVRFVDSHGDPLTRNVIAFVRGTGTKTLLLAGHFDVVSIENYHELKPLSCDSDRLKDALIADLKGRDRSEQEERALDDLLSGDFLPGRGMLDMKSGVAVAIGCIERFAADSDRQGNLMLVVTPDEERESRGIRSFRNALPQLAKDFGIEICGAINLDVTSDQGDGTDGRSAYAGSIGKLLPFAMVVGCSSHTSYPYEGVSAQAMAAGILTRIEGNAALADRDNMDVSPPPICLEARDLRDGYEVTTPERFWVGFNWLYHSSTAEVLFERFQTEVIEGAREAVSRFAVQSQNFGSFTGKSAGALPPEPKLFTVKELKAAARQLAGDDFDKLLAEKERQLSTIDNPLAVSREMTQWLVDLAALQGPAIVVGFATLHYLPTQLDPAFEDDQALKRAIDDVRSELMLKPEQSLQWRPYFQGVSDMSFYGLAACESRTVSDNTPSARFVDIPPSDVLRFPVVNIGPWGREFHQRLERVYTPYAFEVLPRLVSRIIERLFSFGPDKS